MALVVKQDVALCPIGIVLLRGAGIPSKADLAAEFVQKAGFSDYDVHECSPEDGKSL
jgi:hypothetical protein